MSAPQDYKISPIGLEPPAGVRKRKKSYCENTKKPATSFPSYDPKIVLERFMSTFLLHKHSLKKEQGGQHP